MTKLSSGTTYGYDGQGRRAATGSQMGRQDSRLTTEQAALPIKCRLVRLKWVDNDYDEAGAYWGGGMGDFIYRANFVLDEDYDLFVRARSRVEAKSKIRETLPNARFYN